MSDFIAIDIKAETLDRTRLGEAPAAVQNACANAVAEYMLNVVQEQPPYSYVTRAEAYPDALAGPGWFSARQRKYVMAQIRKGAIQPGSSSRTQEFREGWEIIGDGANVMLTNEVPYGIYLKDNDRQARMMAMIGWKKIEQDLEERAEQLVRIMNAAAKNALKKLGLNVT